MPAQPNIKPDSSVEELQKTFIRKAQILEQQRLNKAHMIKMRNRLSGLIMATVVGSIYFYTIMAVKQEKFLDELDDPEPSPSSTVAATKK